MSFRRTCYILIHFRSQSSTSRYKSAANENKSYFLQVCAQVLMITLFMYSVASWNTLISTIISQLFFKVLCNNGVILSPFCREESGYLENLYHLIKSTELIFSEWELYSNSKLEFFTLHWGKSLIRNYSCNVLKISF